MVVFVVFNIGCICGCFGGSLYGVYLWLFMWLSVWGVILVVVAVCTEYAVACFVTLSRSPPGSGGVLWWPEQSGFLPPSPQPAGE